MAPTNRNGMILDMGVEAAKIAIVAKGHSADTGYPFDSICVHAIHYMAHPVAVDVHL